MKYIIDKERIKKLIKKHSGIDLTGNINVIKKFNDVSFPLYERFDEHLPYGYIKHYIDAFGPMYSIITDDNAYLIQPRDKLSIITPASYPDTITESQFMEELGIQMFGLSFNDLMDIYSTN